MLRSPLVFLLLVVPAFGQTEWHRATPESVEIRLMEEGNGGSGRAGAEGSRPAPQGARNLRRAGVDRDVIMRIGGWKTDSVFRRYNIVDEHYMADAMVKLENSRIEQPPAKPEPKQKQQQTAAVN